MPVEALKSKKILVVDDEPVNVMVLEQMLQEGGYENVWGLTDPGIALANCEAYDPDLIVLDLIMPRIDGYQVMERVRSRLPEGVYLPILVVTADASQESRRRALTGGATDFLTKPFDEIEVLLRIEHLLRTRWQYLLLHDENARLDQMVLERTQALEASNKKLEAAQAEIMERLAHAADFRDDETGLHTRRVGETSYLLALELGLSNFHCELIRKAAPLHDVGKIAIPDWILLKPGRLTDAEFAMMRSHPAIGAAILSKGQSPLVQIAEIITLTHHERWDGSGYPRGLSGDDIPIEGQIVGLADVFDALTHSRPYKMAWSATEALNEIERLSGTHFNPTLAEAFKALPHKNLL